MRRCAGMGAAAAAFALLPVVLLLLHAPRPAAAARLSLSGLARANGCGMARCAICEMLPSPDPYKSYRLVPTCSVPKIGYSPAADRLSVPNCGPGFWARSRSSPCERCNETYYAPPAPIGTVTCSSCPDNMTPDRNRGACIALPGYYSKQGRGVGCPKDYWCFQGVARPCGEGTTTNETVAQVSCVFVKPGYFWDDLAFVARACPSNMFAEGVRLRTQAATMSTCTSCPAGLSTNNEAGASGCDYVKGGYFWNGTAATLCAANTSEPLQRKTVKSACDPCKTGTHTNNATGSASCDFLLAGFYWNKTGALQCDQDRYSDFAGKITDVLAQTCQNCSDGTTTNGAVGQIACPYVKPGWYPLADKSAAICAIDSYQPLLLSINTPKNCTKCAAGWSTNGTQGAVNCSGFVAPGYYYNATTMQPVKCAADYFSTPSRSLDDATVGQCTICGDGYTTNATTGATECSTFLKPGYYLKSPNSPAKCPSDSYASGVRSAGTQDGQQCKICLSGWTTNGTEGAADCSTFVKPGCYYNGTAAVPCPPNTFSERVKNTTEATGNNTCTRCPTNTTSAAGAQNCTANTTAAAAAAAVSPAELPPPTTASSAPTASVMSMPQLAPFMAAAADPRPVPPGFRFDPAGPSVLPCPKDTFSRGAQWQSDATTCTPCPDGFTTSGLVAQAACYFVRAGWYWAVGAPRPCPAETHFATARAQAEAAACAPCPAGLTTRGAVGQALCSS